jgi:hypothetical protein
LGGHDEVRVCGARGDQDGLDRQPANLTYYRIGRTVQRGDTYWTDTVAR